MKAIRYNAPKASDKEVFGDDASFTMHTNGFTLYFDRIKDTNAGFVFMKYDIEVGFIGKDDTDISPIVAMEKAEEYPNEKVPFADD